MTLPAISIITPSFNQGEFLEECIDSVLSQNYPNLEYIIMDGGSSDGSVEIIKKYEKYLAYWQSQPDGGQYNAINDGFKKTTGEIMAWLNSDDKYHHNAFFKVAHVFSTHENVEWLTGRHTLWDKDGAVQLIETEWLPEHSREKFFQKQYDKPWIQQESTFWRRSLWEKAGSGLATDLDYAGDLELWLRFFRFAPLYTVDALLGGYRVHGNQKAALFMDKYREEAERVIDEELLLCQHGNHSDLLPTPEPITISLHELRKYRRDSLALAGVDRQGFADEAELVCDYLLKRLLAQAETVQALQSRLEQLTLTRIWRMTAPLRKVLDVFKRR